MIRKANLQDADSITEIYNHYILHHIATFEEAIIDAEEMKSRISNISKEYPFYVFEEENRIIGYAYASRWNTRSAYKFTAQVSIYLHAEARGKGIGSKLYGHLFEDLRSQGYHSLIGGISLPNDASIAIHEKFGFEKVCHYKEIGYKFGKWIDVGYWQLLL